MAEKTTKNPRGAGRKAKPVEDKKKSFTVTAHVSTVAAITALAKRRGLTRGQYIQRLLDVEARKYDDVGKQGRFLGELYAAALAIAKEACGDVERIESLRNAAIDQPALTFPEILDFCALELPRVTLAKGREVLKSRVADLTVALGFKFPETLTSDERAAFESAVEKYQQEKEKK